MKGTGLIGAVIAAALSWVKWHSVFYLFVHFICGWLYVIWYLMVYVLLK